MGYHVAMEMKYRPGLTKIIFMTTGMFLQELVGKKEINEWTHIILDEVHERELDTDFSLVILKHLL